MATIFIKTLIIYLFVLIAIRLMGKREIGQMQPFELVVIIIIADVASVPMQEIGTPILQGVIPIMALLVGEIIVSYLNIKFSLFNKLITGKSTLLIDKGKIVEQNLKKQKYTIEELLQALRIAGYFNVMDVEYAILETSGQISVIPKAEKNPVTLCDLNISPSKVGFPKVIVREGVIYENNLNSLGLNYKWLEKTISAQKIKLEDIFVLIVDEALQIYIQRKER